MLITPEYQAEQQKLHETFPEYGVASLLYAEHVNDIIHKCDITDLLDYGCGKARLAQALVPKRPLRVSLYDPGIPQYAGTPAPHEMVTCIDVLEHIEPLFLDNVLDDLARVTQLVGFFTVHCGPARRILSDGRNAHLTQEPPEWWLPKFAQRFDILEYMPGISGFAVIVTRKELAEVSSGNATIQ